MHRPVAAPFYGSTIDDQGMGETPAQSLERPLSAVSILAALATWGAARALLPQTDLSIALEASSLMLLVCSLIGCWVAQAADNASRNTVASLYNAVFRRLSLTGRQAVHNAPAQDSYSGVAGLIGDFALLIRRLRAVLASERQDKAALSQVLEQCREQAQRVANHIRQEAGNLAETAAEMDFAREHLMREQAVTTQSVSTSETSMDCAASKLAALTDSVRVITAGAGQMTSVTIDLSKHTQSAQRQVAESEENILALTTALDQIEHALQTAAALGHATAARSAGVQDERLVSIARELQDVASTCRPALDLASKTVRQLVAEIAEANRRTIEVSNLVLTHREISEAIGQAVQQQGADITQSLNHIYEARTGFAAIRASIDNITSGKDVRPEIADKLRLAALHLPEQAESIATLLHGVPDLAPYSRFRPTPAQLTEIDIWQAGAPCPSSGGNRRSSPKQQK